MHPIINSVELTFWATIKILIYRCFCK